MFNKINAAFVFATILTSLVLSGCAKEKSEKTDVEVKGFKEIQVVGYGCVKIPENAGANGKILARRRASMMAAANLVAQISGIEFSFEKKKGESATLKIFETSSDGVIKGSNTEYYYIGNNVILARQTIITKIPVSGIDNAVFFETSLTADNLQKSMTREYRNAVKQIVSKKYPGKTEVTGKIYLSDMNIVDKGKGNIEVKIKVLIALQ